MNAQKPQPFPYDQKWREIDSAAQKGNLKSLLPQVNTIYKQATADNNRPQIVKALITQSAILAQTKEDNDDDNAYKIAIVNFETEIATMDKPENEITKTVLQSLLAGIYWQYEQNTRWKRHNITELETLPADIAEWSSRQLLQKSMDLYRLSIKNPAILKKVKTSVWENLLKSSRDIALFPTLYDVLTVRYIKALEAEDREKWAAEIDDLLLKLENFHKNDNSLSAYLNYVLMRITNKKITDLEKAEEILTLAQSFKTARFAAYLYFSAAEIYANSGNKRRAYEICKLVEVNSSNRWADNAQNLISELKTPQIQINIDGVNLPDEPIAVSVAATNVNKIFYRIYENKPSITSSGHLSEHERGKLLKSGSWNLRHFDDFLPHATLAKLDGLPQGNYCIAFSNTPKFAKRKEETDNMKEETYFAVHNWSVIKLDNVTFQLLHRKTGAPFANKPLDLELEYNEKLTHKTDGVGTFTLGPNVRYIFNSESKTYIPVDISRYYYNDYDNDMLNRGYRIDIFTDRAIYRPGQKVYFKAILYDKNKNEAKIIANKQVVITLTNANDQKIATRTLITNEYGSVFGEFELPQGGLTGRYSLDSDYDSPEKDFLVEEYKRPKFEVLMDDFTGEFVLEKEVTTTGKAESYAGAAISEAKVVYRVERLEIFPYRCWWFPPQNTQNETIIQGETQTDTDGKFSIAFIAKPKNSKKIGEYRTYIYKIIADVSDINGETHTAVQSVTIGDLPKMLSLNLPSLSLQKNFTEIGVQSTNLNGTPEHSQGQIVVTQLISPDRIILPNKTGTPDRETFYYQNYYDAIIRDYQLYSKEEFVKYFPHLPYAQDETKPEKWQHGKRYFFDFDTEKSEKIALTAQLSKGFYLVEAVTMFGKDSIKTSKIIEIQDNNNFKSTNNTFFIAYTDKPNYNVGDKIKIVLSSDLPNAIAILNIESGGKWVTQEALSITKGTIVYDIIATENHIKNGLFVSAYLLAENSYKQFSFAIPVKSKPMDLKISTKTFRDKISPALQETWELTISGVDKERATAEVLATMYDASLDAFASNGFDFNPLYHHPYGIFYGNIRFLNYREKNLSLSPFYKYLRFNHPEFTDFRNLYFDRVQSVRGNRYDGRAMMIDGVKIDENDLILNSVSEVQVSANYDDVIMPARQPADKMLLSMESNTVSEIMADATTTSHSQGQGTSAGEQPALQIRKNLQETAFFYPNLYTDASGDVKFTFTSPEALTKWKLLVLAHTKDLHSGSAEFYTQTQKELMVIPNLPRFLREGDEIVISAKINNLSGKKLEFCSAVISLFDALNGNPIMGDGLEKKVFLLEENKNAVVSWRIKIPLNVQAIEYKIVAEAFQNKASSNGYSDGEQGILPVLPNRMLVTETMPIYAKEGQTKTFTMKKLSENASNTLQNFNLSLEITANPLWLAVMSLPYLREYPYECSEQIFSRLYGNLLSTHILNSNPKIKQVFDNWNAAGYNISKLEQNEELKNILLEETPFLRNAQNENEQRQRLALLFDLSKMSQELAVTQQKLTQRQNQDGGFSWFPGGESSPYITEHIVQGFGQLRNMLGENNLLNFQNLSNLIAQAIKYIDKQQVKEIREAKKDAIKDGEKVDGKEFIHYYYVRSFWLDKFDLPLAAKKYLTDINKNIPEYFTTYDLQRKAMIATTLYRYKYPASAEIILKNLKETSVETDEMGMYWKDNRAGWYWYQSPVEAQAKAIEAFAEIAQSKNQEKNASEAIKYMEEMKIWLMKNRQTNAWNSTKATTEAVYALTSLGKEWANAEQGVNVWAGNNEIIHKGEPVPSDKSDNVAQTAGYFKTSWKGGEITADKGVVKVEKSSPGVMWGGLYWQYFENLDKITSANSNVKMEKQLFVKINSDNGQKLIEVSENQSIKVGDLVTVRLVVRIDRDMEYIHIKDMRAAGFEPVNVLSGYKYQNGCSYYESTRDAATNFFFERMTKGVYVFEYDVRANNAGLFSNGITTLQNMYAPEMSCHSEGIKVIIRD